MERKENVIENASLKQELREVVSGNLNFHRKTF